MVVVVVAVVIVVDVAEEQEDDDDSGKWRMTRKAKVTPHTQARTHAAPHGGQNVQLRPTKSNNLVHRLYSKDARKYHFSRTSCRESNQGRHEQQKAYKSNRPARRFFGVFFFYKN